MKATDSEKQEELILYCDNTPYNRAHPTREFLANKKNNVLSFCQLPYSPDLAAETFQTFIKIKRNSSKCCRYDAAFKIRVNRRMSLTLFGEPTSRSVSKSDRITRSVDYFEEVDVKA